MTAMTVRAGYLARQPFVLGLAGFALPGSPAELVMRDILRATAAKGARTRLIRVRDLELPLHSPLAPHPVGATVLWQAVHAADAIVLGALCPDGNIGGQMANAMDHLEVLGGSRRSCLRGMPAATVVSADDWEPAVTAQGTMRQVVHALGGWPTPLGIVVNTADPASKEWLASTVDILAGHLLSGLPASMRPARSDAAISHAS